jgi:hypothetical protein
MTKGQKYKQEWTKRYTENLRLGKAAILYFTNTAINIVWNLSYR